MNHLGDVDAEELGEAIDMLKDLEEAIYYTTITEAMSEGDSKKNKSEHHKEEMMYYSTPTMYMDDRSTHDNNHSTGTHDAREGRSSASRKMYMEAKNTSSDKAMQLRELEKYMQELTNDIVEMIQDSSPEEKSYMEKKMTTLAAKIGSMK